MLSVLSLGKFMDLKHRLALLIMMSQSLEFYSETFKTLEFHSHLHDIYNQAL